MFELNSFWVSSKTCEEEEFTRDEFCNGRFVASWCVEKEVFCSWRFCMRGTLGLLAEIWVICMEVDAEIFSEGVPKSFASRNVLPSLSLRYSLVWYTFMFSWYIAESALPLLLDCLSGFRSIATGLVLWNWTIFSYIQWITRLYTLKYLLVKRNILNLNVLTLIVEFGRDSVDLDVTLFEEWGTLPTYRNTKWNT